MVPSGPNPMRVVAALALGVALAGSVRAQVVFSDGFETPVLSGTLNIYGAFTFGAWSGVAMASGGNAGVVRGTDNGLAPYSGAQHFTFNGGENAAGGWIQTTFATTVGAQYQVDFALGRSGSLGFIWLNTRLEVRDGAGVVSTSGDYSAPEVNGTYVLRSMVFTALESETTLRWVDTSSINTSSDLYLDGVTVTQIAAVPEPAHVAAALGVLATCAAVVGRMRRAARSR